MVATDKLFAASIPEIYDRLLVSLLFETYALDLAPSDVPIASDAERSMPDARARRFSHRSIRR